MHRTWPGGNGKRGFSKEQGSRQAHFPTHLLAGGMVCGSCGATIAQLSGKSGGYYGCLAATKGACDNKTLVRRTLAEKVILGAVQEQIRPRAHLVRAPARRRGDRQAAFRPPRRAQAEGSGADRRAAPAFELCRLHRRGARQPGARQGPVETERRVDTLSGEVGALRRSREKIFQPPPIEWIKDRMSNIHQVLEQRTARSAQMLRTLLGPIRLALVGEPPPGLRRAVRFFPKVDADAKNSNRCDHPRRGGDHRPGGRAHLPEDRRQGKTPAGTRDERPHDRTRVGSQRRDGGEGRRWRPNSRPGGAPPKKDRS